MAPAPVRDVPLGQHQVPVDASTAETASEDTALFQEIASLKEEVLTIEEVFKEENHQLKQAIARLQQQVDDGTVAATASMSEPRRAQSDYNCHLDQSNSWSRDKLLECVKCTIYEFDHCHDPKNYIKDTQKRFNILVGDVS